MKQSSGPMPFGFRRDGDKLIPSIGFDAVERMAHLHAQGVQWALIGTALLSEGFVPPGNPFVWHPKTMQKCVKNYNEYKGR